jgi:hypothetical protein
MIAMAPTPTPTPIPAFAPFEISEEPEDKGKSEDGEVTPGNVAVGAPLEVGEVWVKF